MSAKRSHPPHTRARLPKAGLIATGIVGSAVTIGLVSSATAAPSVPTHDSTPAAQTQGLGVTASRVADTAESVVTTHPPLVTGVQISGAFAQQRAEQAHQQQVAEHFYNTVLWDAAVAKNLAWENAVAKAMAEKAAAQARASAAASGTPGGNMPTSVAGMFACIRNAESGGNYSAVNSSSGAGGAYQFMPSTWASLGGAGLPENAPPAEQDAMALKLYQRDGWSPWRGDRCVG
jgi:hypothetical protein